MLYIISGCDYISYFAGLGKAAIFNAFFHHASFISGQNMCGMLSNNSGDMVEEGFLTFLQLIGTLRIMQPLFLSKELKPHNNCLTLRKNNFLKICTCSGITE